MAEGEGRRVLTREAQAKSDVQKLLSEPHFRRFLYCVLMDANVLRGYHGAKADTVQWWDGRRSLGLDILATMQGVSPDALLLVLDEERKTRLETTYGRRTSDRRTELDPDPDGRQRSDGRSFLDYSDAGE